MHEHTEQFHLYRLNSLCRICGGRSQKKQQKQAKESPIQCRNYAEDLKNVLGVVVSQDTDGTVCSSTMCSKCYFTLKNLKRKACSSGKTKGRAVSLLQKSKFIWTRYNGSLSAQDCSVCSQFLHMSRGGRPLKPDTSSSSKHSSLTEESVSYVSPPSESTPVEQAALATEFQSPSTSGTETSINDNSVLRFSPPSTSTPEKQTAEVTQALQPSTLACLSPVRDTASSVGSHTVDAATSPIAEKSVRQDDQIQFPFTKAEDRLYTLMTRRKLAASEDKETAECVTGGQRFYLRRIVNPRKSTATAKSPLAKKRARIIDKIRKRVAGAAADDIVRQQGTELKLTSVKTRRNILHKAGCVGKHVSSKEAIRMKAKLSLTWKKHRDQRKFLKKSGIVLSTEAEERQFQEKLLCGKISVSQNAVYFYDKITNTETRKVVPVASIKDLPGFVSSLLDQYQQKQLLTWHDGSIPSDEIWLKIGGDHGGNSFKLSLQVLNVQNPNAKDSTFLICLVECKDSVQNLKAILEPFRDKISSLSQQMWNEKRLRLFLFGDYDFVLKLYGLSGPQAVHPCLWCKASKQQIQRPPSEQAIHERSLHNIKCDHKRFKRAGEKKKNAKAFNNVVTEPIWDIELTHVAPPYLHLLLGIVKKHHDLLKKECHSLDVQIARDLSKERTVNPTVMTAQFHSYVKRCKIIQKKKEEKEDMEKRGSQIIFQELFHDAAHDEAAEQKQQIYDAVDVLDDEIHKLQEDQGELYFGCGPVTTNLESILNQHRIVTQAFHSHSFIGNHCNKYLKKNVYTAICNSVVRKTFQLTDNNDTHDLALEIKSKFLHLNSLFSKVHEMLSHRRPVGKHDFPDIENAIMQYMQYFRRTFATVKILPKQHILEAHCVPFIKQWGFGMALHGEQGGEQMHATVNQLKRRAWGIRNDGERLKVLMREQQIRASPMLENTPTKKKKKN